jgi:hypothetical protein
MVRSSGLRQFLQHRTQTVSIRKDHRLVLFKKAINVCFVARGSYMHCVGKINGVLTVKHFVLICSIVRYKVLLPAS